MNHSVEWYIYLGTVGKDYAQRGNCIEIRWPCIFLGNHNKHFLLYGIYSFCGPPMYCDTFYQYLAIHYSLCAVCLKIYSLLWRYVETGRKMKCCSIIMSLIFYMSVIVPLIAVDICVV